MTAQRTNCPICNSVLAQPPAPMGDGSGYFFDCPKCGPYRLTEEAVENVETYRASHPDSIPYIPHAIRRMSSSERGGPFIFSETLEQIFKDPPKPSPFEQADNLIHLLGDNQIDPGTSIYVGFDICGALIGAPSNDAFMFVVNSLKSKEIIGGRVYAGGNADIKLTFEGWSRYEELKQGAASGETAFLAMEFGHSGLEAIVETCFRPAVDQTGFQLRALNDLEHQRAGLIDDRLRIEIKAARFVISDLTHKNEGAYWEAGYAEGLGKPVIYTCEKTVFNERSGGTHFDTNHHLHILWSSDTHDEVAKNLKACIRATIPEAKQTD